MWRLPRQPAGYRSLMHHLLICLLSITGFILPDLQDGCKIIRICTVREYEFLGPRMEFRAAARLEGIYLGHRAVYGIMDHA